MNYRDFERHIKHLQGSVLTVVDASHSDRSQCKAIKDLINSAFSRKMIEVHDEEVNQPKESSQHEQRQRPVSSNP